MTVLLALTTHQTSLPLDGFNNCVAVLAVEFDIPIP
jgi:hypothetical protein